MQTQLFRRAAAVVAVAAVLGSGTAVADTMPSGLERFYRQTLSWGPCGDAELVAAGAECGEVTVPVDYGEPERRTIGVAISRLRATDPGQRRGVLLTNPGGPGEAGLAFPLSLRPAMTAAVLERYDLIGMDPRGAGRSAALDCGWPVGFGLQSAGVDPASFLKSVALQAELAARCQVRAGDLLPHITTRNTARDMDVVRAALGAPVINYFGTSAGTYLGAVYTQMFPGRSDRVVLDSAIDPQKYGDTARQPDRGRPNELALDAWAEWAAARDSEYRLGGTGKEVRGRVEELIRRAGREPIRFGPFLIDDRTLPVLLFLLNGDTRRYPDLATQVRQLADAAQGRPVQLDPQTEARLTLILSGRPQDLSALNAVMCGDARAPRNPLDYWRDVEASRATEPVFGPFFNNINPCAFWAAPREPATVVDNATPALIVQATGDTRAIYPGGLAMHRALTGSRMITLQDVAVHSLFGNIANRCVDTAINTYLAEGVLPGSDLVCHTD